MSAPQPPAASAPERSRRTWLLLGRSARVVLASGLALLVLLLLALQVPRIGTGLANSVLRRISIASGAKLAVGEVRGNWLTRLELRDLRLARGDTVLAAADTVRVGFRPWKLLTGRIDLAHVELAGPEVSLAPAAAAPDTTRGPRLGVGGILRGRFYAGPKLRVDRLDVRRGRWRRTADPDAPGPRVTGVTLAARGVELGNTLAVVVDSLALQYVPVQRGAEAIRLFLAASVAGGRLDIGGLRLAAPGSDVVGKANLAIDARDSTSTVEIELHADPAALGDLVSFLPGGVLRGDVTADVALHGPRLDQLSGTVRVDFTEAQLRGLDFGPTRLAADFTAGRATLEVTTTWDGAGAEIHGWMRPLDRTPEYDLAVRLDRLPGRLPGVPAWEAIARRGGAATSVHVSGRGYADAALQVEAEAISDAGGLKLRGRLGLRPDLEWDLQRLAIDDLDLARWLGDASPSRLSGTITAHGSGARAASLQLAAAWDLAASRYGKWEVLSGSGRANLDGARLGGTLHLATAAGTVAIDTLSALLGGAGEFEIPAVRFRGLDLAQVTGSRELPSDLNGTLRLRGAAPRSAAAGASVWRRLDASARLSLEPSRFRERRIEAGDAELRLRDGVFDADATMSTDAGRARVRAQARPFDVPRAFEAREIRFADVDVAAWANTSLPTRLTGLLSGKATGRRTSGARSAEGDRTASGLAASLPDWSAKLRLEPSRVGSIDIAGAEAAADFTSHDFSGRARLRTAPGEAVFETRGTIAGRKPAGSISLVLPFGVVAALAGRDSLATAGELRADARFEGLGLDSAVVDARVGGRGRAGGWSVDSLRAALRLEGGVLAVDTLALRSNATGLDVSGRLVLSESARTVPSDLRLELRAVDPSALGALLGADTLALGRGELQARVTGSPSARSFTLQAAVDSVTWNGLRLDGARTEAQGVLDSRWRPVRTTATAQLTRFRHAAARFDEAEVRADLDRGALHLDLDAKLDAAHRLSLAGTAARDSAGLRVRLVEAQVEAEKARWKLVRPAELRWGNDRLALDSLEVRSDSALVLAHGTLDRHGDQDFSLRAEHVGLDVLASWLAHRDLGGMLDGQLAISGPAAAPRAQGSMRVSATAAGAPVGVAEARLTWDGRQARMQGFFASPSMDSVSVAGDLPLGVAWFGGPSAAPPRGTEGELQLRLVAHRFPLSELLPLLPPNAVARLEGLLDADVRVSGRRARLLGEGHVGIANGVVELPSLGVTYQDLQLDGALSGDRFSLRDCRARSGKGDLQATGDLRIAGPALVEARLEATFRDFVFTNMPDLRVVATGDLRIGGSTSAPEITGRLKASDCTYFITKGSMGGAQSGAEVVLTPADLRMLEETFGSQYVAGASPMRGVYAASALDLQVSLTHDNWVRKRNAPVLALAITGDVRVRKPAHGQLNLQGRIAPVPGRSYIEQFGRTFDFVGGEVLLNGATRDHTVDIRTEYKVRSPSGSDEPEVVVHLDVVGDADKLRLDLSSEPPLSDSEIITYITTGRSPIKPQSSTQTGSEAAALAAEIGLSQVTGALEHTVQEKVGLDVLQVRYDAMQGATLWAGRYVNPELYVGVQQPLQYQEEGTNSTQNPYQTVVDLEYEAYRWLIVNLQGEASVVRSFLRARHAY